MKPVLDFSSFLYRDVFQAIFTTQEYPYNSPEDRIHLARDYFLSSENLVIPIQTHTANIALVTQPGRYDETDGIFTRSDKLVLSIQVADCIPIYLVEATSGFMGLVHAGWRGIVAGIIGNSIKKINELNINLPQVKCYLGPSIRACCFEVGNDILHRFPPDYHIITPGKRPHINLQQLVVDQLRSQGIPDGNISSSPACTHCDDGFHSFRRDGKKTGRMIAMLGRNPG